MWLTSASVQQQKITDKTTLNNRIMQMLCKTGYNNKTVGKVTSVVSDCFNKAERKKLIHNELVQIFGQSKADEIYSLIKELL